MKIVKGRIRAVRGFYSRVPAGLSFFATVVVIASAIIFASWVFGLYEEISFSRQTPADHLRAANAAFREHDFDNAILHAAAIPPQAPEYEAANTLRRTIQVKREQADEAEKEITRRQQEVGHERMLGNRSGRYHDSFKCETSERNGTHITFDNGVTWWADDDGRCPRPREDPQQNAQATQSGDVLSSYVPTTIRVDTDIDSFWLNNEERNCKTFPDSNGRVAVVACNENGNHRVHNIPIRFWGSVGRSVISSWKCRREGDNFVCRALD